MSEAYVTLATNDKYALGALVLAHSLRSVETTKQLCILITPSVSDSLRSQLSEIFNNVVVVDVLDSKDSSHLSLLRRPELGVTFTKLHCWTLTQYSKCVFLDADMLAVQNSDELFNQPELSAACDIGWPDCFNSGMFVFVPSEDTYQKLIKHAEEEGSFDGGDQGLLNTFFPNWNRISFVYNMVASVTYTYSPAYHRFGKDVKLVHFLGATKPWQQSFHVPSGSVASHPGQEQLTGHLNAWWRIYTNLVQTELPEEVCTPRVDASSPTYMFQEHSQDNTCCLPTTFSTNNMEYFEHKVNRQYKNQHSSFEANAELVDSEINPIFPLSSAPPHPQYNLVFKQNPVVCPKEEKGPCLVEQTERNLNQESDATNCHLEKESVSVPICFSKEPTSSIFCDASILNRDTSICKPSNNEVTKHPTVQQLSRQLTGLSISASELEESRARFESGRPDFMGRDSFDNIQAYLDAQIKK